MPCPAIRGFAAALPGHLTPRQGFDRGQPTRDSGPAGIPGKPGTSLVATIRVAHIIHQSPVFEPTADKNIDGPNSDQHRTV